MPRRPEAPKSLIAAIAASAALGLAGCGGSHGDAQPQEGLGGPNTAVPTVSVQIVSPQPAQRTVTLPGRVAASRVAQVRPQVDGIIVERAFVEGSDVEAGDPLYRIDPAPYRAAYEQAEAELERAEAAITAAAARRSRFERLVERGGVSRQEYEDAAADAATAEAAIAVARAARDSAKIDLDRTTILSPIAGRIGRSSVTEGALVAARQSEALATVTALDPVFVDVTRPSADLLAMRRRGGMTGEDVSVELTLEDGSEYGMAGKLTLSEVEVDPASGSVTLRAVFPNPDGILLPGMFVRATIDEGTDRDAILVPQAAVSRTPDGQGQVYVLTGENEATARTVRTDRVVGQDWVVSGLEPGDVVIVDGFQRFTAGDTVVPRQQERVAASRAGSGASGVGVQ